MEHTDSLVFLNKKIKVKIIFFILYYFKDVN